MCGGGGFNPISAITDPISSALGTDGGGGGVLGALADIDPGPAIGSGLAEVDDFVGDSVEDIVFDASEKKICRCCYCSFCCSSSM
jgi:hypothetical protein